MKKWDCKKIGVVCINWLIVDSSKFFDQHRQEYDVKKGSKGIRKHVEDMLKKEFLLVYRTKSQSVDQIYRVTNKWYPTNRVDFPKAIGVEFVEKLDIPLTWEVMKSLTPNLEYVKDSMNRAIGEIKPNEWKILKDYIIKYNPHLNRLFK